MPRPSWKQMYQYKSYQYKSPLGPPYMWGYNGITLYHIVVRKGVKTRTGRALSWLQSTRR